MNDRGKAAAPQTVDLFVWRIGDIEFDEPQWELRVSGRPVTIELKPLEVLACLLRHAGEVVTKEELLTAVWPGVIVVEAALSNAVTKLRKALDDEQQNVIATVYRVGYRFIGKVTRKVTARQPVPQLFLEPGDFVPKREQWRLVELLNVSPNSEVWLATHAKTRKRRVFKFSPNGLMLSALKREATLSRVLTETLGERRDLVRVLEWNFSEPPYFVESEYGGPDLTRWAELQGGLLARPLNERLELFAQIAEAIAAAHSAGVLHKDIKPGNVLVSNDDTGRIYPKVVDFGNAKLLAPDSLDALNITRLGFTQTMTIDSLSGTLFYVAPEVLKGQPPTAQADVYALGVVLYQLIVGDLNRPLTAGWESGVEDELLRSDIAEAADGDPHKRMASALMLAERIRGLETRRVDLIAQREAAQRLMMADIQLSRAHARRPWVFTTTVILLAGISTTTFMYLREHAAKVESVREAAIANDTLSFVNEDVLGLADPYEATGGRDVTLIQALREAEKSIDRRFADSPEALAHVHRTLGEAYQNLGDRAAARRHLEAGLRVAEAMRPADMELLHRLRILLGDADINEEMPDQAWDIYTAAYEADRQSLGERNPLTLEARMSQGWARLRQGQPEEALAIHMEVLRMAEAQATPNADLIDGIHWDLAEINSALAHWDEATADIEASMDATRKSYGPDSSRLLWEQISLAYILQTRGRDAEGEALFHEIETKSLAKLGPDHQITAAAFQYSAEALYRRGEWANAMGGFEKARVAYGASLGVNHHWTRRSAQRIAECLARLGRANEAVPQLEALVHESEAQLGAKNPASIELKRALLDIYVRAGDLPSADRALIALKAESASLPVDDELWPAIHETFAEYYSANNDVQAAASERLLACNTLRDWNELGTNSKSPCGS